MDSGIGYIFLMIVCIGILAYMLYAMGTGII